MVHLKLNVLTLNCWGIPVGSSHRKERMNAIAEELGKGEYDLACLQEVWLQSDYWRIRQKTRQLLPFAHYFYSGVLGSGVCILSKFPIQDVFFHQWPVNGYIHKIHHGDWFGGKGVGLCQVSAAGVKIHIYTTHLHAEYNRQSDEYMVHRVLQAFDLSQMVRTTSVGADVVILAGDLNTEPEDLAQRIICQNSELHDAYTFTHQSERAQNSLNEEIISNGTEVSQNHEELLKTPPVTGNKDGGTSRRSSIPLWAGFQQDLSKRIDYILFRSGPEVQVWSPRTEIAEILLNHIAKTLGMDTPNKTNSSSLTQNSQGLVNRVPYGNITCPPRSEKPREQPLHSTVPAADTEGRSGSVCTQEKNNTRTWVHVESYRQPLPQKVPNCGFSYSDHEAVLATLRITKGYAQTMDPPALDSSERVSSLKEAVVLCDQALVDIRRARYHYWLFSCTLLLVLLATLGYESPGAYHKMYNTGRVLLTLVLSFAVGMAGVWYSMEENGILAGKQGMEVVLGRLERETENGRDQ